MYYSRHTMENETIESPFLWNAYYCVAYISFYVFFGTIYISACKQNICALEALGHPGVSQTANSSANKITKTQCF